jgi:hypothetical protein
MCREYSAPLTVPEARHAFLNQADWKFGGFPFSGSEQAYSWGLLEQCPGIAKTVPVNQILDSTAATASPSVQQFASDQAPSLVTAAGGLHDGEPEMQRSRAMPPEATQARKQAGAL